MILNAEIMALDAVKEEPWNGPNGPIWFVQGRFKDGCLFSTGAKSHDGALKRHAEFEAMIGKVGEFDGEPNGEYNGHKKYKLKSWPGKPALTMGGSQPRRDFQPRYRDTENGTREERECIARSVALQQAVQFQIGVKGTAVIETADEFYAWLIAPMAASRAALLAEQMGMTTADSLPPANPSEPYKKAITKITAAVRDRNVEEVARILNVAETAHKDGKLSDNEHKSIAHECTLALRKIKELEREPLPV